MYVFGDISYSIIFPLELQLQFLGEIIPSVARIIKKVARPSRPAIPTIVRHIDFGFLLCSDSDVGMTMICLVIDNKRINKYILNFFYIFIYL